MTGSGPRQEGSRTKDKILRAYVDQMMTPAARPSGSSESGRPRTASPAAGIEEARSRSMSPGPMPVLRPISEPPIPGDPSLVGGKYRLGKLLGRGGIGEVFEATHEVIGGRLAVKLIRSEYAENAELSARFIQEARAAAAVGHPGIVQVHDVGVTEDGRTYLVMEFLDGEDLQSLLKRKGRLPVGEAAAIFADVLDALSAVHARGIVHRDMKPENVFLTKGPRGDRVIKLLDFGIARLVDRDQTMDRLTRPGLVMGTPYYMSPEQARGQTDIDGRADVYAVGVMLYEALSARLPYDGSSYNEVLSKVLQGRMPSVRALVPDVPLEVERLIARAASANRDNRFADAAEASALLLPFRSLSARGPTDSPVPGTPALRRTPAVTGAQPVVPEEPGVDGEPESAEDPTRPPRRSSTVRPLSVPSSAPSRGRQVAIFLGGTLLSAGLVVLGVVLGQWWRDPEPAVSAANGGGVVETARVRIRVTGVPAEGEVRYDGRPVAADFEVPAAQDVHVIEVRLPGRDPWVKEIRPSADLELTFLPPPPRGEFGPSGVAPASGR
jgi:serine/threonine-protein kinase